MSNDCTFYFTLVAKISKDERIVMNRLTRTLMQSRCCPDVHNVEFIYVHITCWSTVNSCSMDSNSSLVGNSYAISFLGDLNHILFIHDIRRPALQLTAGNCMVLCAKQSKRQDVRKYTAPGHIKWTNYLLAVTISCRRRRIVC